MGCRFNWSLILSGMLLAIGCSPSAHADYLNEWIAITCDSSSGLAAVRFGYADGDALPLFIQGDPAIDHGLTTRTPANASQREASCSLPDGREVKVRLETGYYSGGDQYSIWVDKIRVFHRDIDAEADLPFEMIVYPTGFRVCHFKMGPGGPYNVTSAGADLPPPEIHCDTAMSPIQGPPDIFEYPPAGSVKPRAGSIVVSGREASLCQKIMTRVGDDPPKTIDFGNHGDPDNDAVVGARLGTVLSTDITTRDFTRIPGFKSIESPATFAFMRALDIFGDGRPLPVYVFARSSYPYPGVFLVVPPSEVTRGGVIAATNGMRFYDIEHSAQSRKWRVFSDDQASADSGVVSELKVIQTDQGFRLFWHGDDKAVLVKPLATGGVETECAFDEVLPHF